MKGLLFKDYLCLRKGMKNLILVSLGILIMGIMFVLSSQYGNLAVAKEAMVQDTTMSEADVFIGNHIIEMAIYIMLIIPVAFVSNVTACFKEDAQVGFGKPLNSMPLTMWEIAGSRYLVCLLIAVVSMGASTVSAFFISVVSGLYDFSKLLGVILTAGAGFLIYMSLVLLLLYVFGFSTRRAEFILVAPLFVLEIAAVTKVAISVISIEKLSEDELLALFKQMIGKMAEIINGGFIWLFLIAGLCMAVSYVGSVALLKHRKGGL